MRISKVIFTLLLLALAVLFSLNVWALRINHNLLDIAERQNSLITVYKEVLEKHRQQIEDLNNMLNKAEVEMKRMQETIDWLEGIITGGTIITFSDNVTPKGSPLY